MIKGKKRETLESKERGDKEMRGQKDSWTERYRNSHGQVERNSNTQRDIDGHMKWQTGKQT